jgi:hypothetical protein
VQGVCFDEKGVVVFLRLYVFGAVQGEHFFCELEVAVASGAEEDVVCYAGGGDEERGLDRVAAGEGFGPGGFGGVVLRALI